MWVWFEGGSSEIQRKKRTRAAGYKTHFSGIGGKQHRGAGTHGGKGRAGHGKRAAHKKLSFIKEPKKKGFFYPLKKEIKSINISELYRYDTKEIDLAKEGFNKLLGKGEISRPVKVKVEKCSKKAREKIEKAGGEIVEL